MNFKMTANQEQSLLLRCPEELLTLIGKLYLESLLTEKWREKKSIPSEDSRRTEAIFNPLLVCKTLLRTFQDGYKFARLEPLPSFKISPIKVRNIPNDITLTLPDDFIVRINLLLKLPENLKSRDAEIMQRALAASETGIDIDKEHSILLINTLPTESHKLLKLLVKLSDTLQKVSIERGNLLPTHTHFLDVVRNRLKLRAANRQTKSESILLAAKQDYRSEREINSCLKNPRCGLFMLFAMITVMTLTSIARFINKITMKPVLRNLHDIEIAREIDQGKLSLANLTSHALNVERVNQALVKLHDNPSELAHEEEVLESWYNIILMVIITIVILAALISVGTVIARCHLQRRERQLQTRLSEVHNRFFDLALEERENEAQTMAEDTENPDSGAEQGLAQRRIHQA